MLPQSCHYGEGQIVSVDLKLQKLSKRILLLYLELLKSTASNFDDVFPLYLLFLMAKVFSIIQH